jgi:hypothetical protein
MIEVEKDWRKYAAQTYSDQEVEKAFLDQAYMFIQNKATPLMKPPHRLGFEIVYKNDANSKMVGIFAFKVGDELIYAPVFFINGAVKGTDLLYRHRSKNFVPLTNDWAEYILGLQESEVGEGLSKENAEPRDGGLNMQRLIYPPSYAGNRKKYASYKELADINEQLPSGQSVYSDIQAASKEVLSTEKSANVEQVEALVAQGLDIISAIKQAYPNYSEEEVQALAANMSKSASAIKNFIVEDGGYHTIELLVSAMEKNASFAEAMTILVGPDNFLPQELNEETAKQSVKSASEKQDRGVTLHIGALNSNIKEASEDLYKKGYQIEDNRAPEGVVDKVFEDKTDGKEFTGASEPGVHELLAKDGDSVRCLVAPCNNKDLTLDIDREWLDDRDSYDNPGQKSLVAIDLDSGKTKTTKPEKLVVINAQEKAKEEGSDDDSDLDKLSDTPSTGKYYQMLDVSGKAPYDKTLSKPFYVKSKDSGGGKGVDKFTIDYSKNDWGDGVDLTLNPDYDNNDYDDRVFKKGDVAFIEVDKENKSLALATHTDLQHMLVEGGVKKASVYKKGDYFVIRDGDSVSEERSKVATVCSLMRNYDFSERLSDSVIGRATESQPFHFIAPVMEKGAHNLSFEQPPEFEQDTDETFGIAREQPQSVQIVADSDTPEQDEARVGDSVKFNDAASLGTKGPMELAQMSEEMSMPSIFEHGVIGSLSKTYNSSLMIDKYLPDLETALDKLGRMIFLFYWKPEDFSDLYGEDDQSGLENTLLSNFTSFGDLVLELLKKRKSYSDSVGNSY